MKNSLFIVSGNASWRSRVEFPWCKLAYLIENEDHLDEAKAKAQVNYNKHTTQWVEVLFTRTWEVNMLRLSGVGSSSASFKLNKYTNFRVYLHEV